MLRKFLSVIPLFICLSVSAQIKLIGRIIDGENKPVSYSSVFLITRDSLIVKNEVTDIDGRFLIITKPGDYILRATLLGKLLTRRALHLNADTNLREIEVDVANELKLVTVNGQKPIVQQDMDKLVFNVENSPFRKGYNGLDILARSPKLQVNADGAIILRNKTPDVYVNGRKLNLSGQALTSYLSGLNAEMMKSIEIQTIGSAELDASATGGIVNIILKKPVKGFTSNLITSYTYRKGNYWSDYAGINNNYGSDKWNFYSKVDYGKDNDFGVFTTTKDFGINKGVNISDGSFTGQKRNMNLLGGIVIYPDKRNEFGAELYYNTGKGIYNTLEQLSVYAPALSSISNNYRIEDFNNNVWYATAYYTYKLDSIGSNLKFIGDIGHNRNQSVNSTNSDYSFGNFPSSLTTYNINPVSDYYIIQGDLSKKYKGGLLLRTGLKFSSVDRKNILITTLQTDSSYSLPADGQENFANREDIVAGYATLSGKFDKRNNFRIGLRSEYTDLAGTDNISRQNVSQHYIDFFPRLYYGYSITSDRTLSLSFFRSIQRPSFRDLNPFITKENDYSYITGNPDLRPQYTNSLDLSYQLSKQSVSFYANQTTNLIAGVYSNLGNVTYYKPTNFGKQAQYGLDYNYYSDLNKWLYTNVSAGTYYYTFDQGTLHPSQFSFNSNIYTRLKLSKTVSVDALNVFNSRFQNYVVSGAPQYRLDVSLQKNILSGKALIKLAFNDVFNTQRDRNFSTYEDFTLDFYQKRRTQSLMLMFVYNFSTSQKVKNKSVDSNNDIKGRL